LSTVNSRLAIENRLARSAVAGPSTITKPRTEAEKNKIPVDSVRFS
jgi:hypothetical protein